MSDTERLMRIAASTGEVIDDLVQARREAVEARVRLVRLRGAVAMAQADLEAAELREDFAATAARQAWQIFRPLLEDSSAQSLKPFPSR